jgi:hypothetical protein
MERKMKTGVIIGSALAGAAAGAILTLDKRERDQVMDLLGTIKDKVMTFAGDVKDKAVDLVDKLPGKVKEMVPESVGVTGGAKESKGGNGRAAQTVKGMKGGKAKAKSTGRAKGSR